MDADDGIHDGLRRASAAQRLAMERALAPLEITPAQFAALRIVTESPGISAAEVARIEHLTPPTMSVILANLERKCALTRSAHPRNARIQCLEPTARGRELCSRARESTAGVGARIISAASTDARNVIRAWLRSVSNIEV